MKDKQNTPIILSKTRPKHTFSSTAVLGAWAGAIIGEAVGLRYVYNEHSLKNRRDIAKYLAQPNELLGWLVVTARHCQSHVLDNASLCATYRHYVRHIAEEVDYVSWQAFSQGNRNLQAQYAYIRTKTYHGAALSNIAMLRLIPIILAHWDHCPQKLTYHIIENTKLTHDDEDTRYYCALFGRLLQAACVRNGALEASKILGALVQRNQSLQFLREIRPRTTVQTTRARFALEIALYAIWHGLDFEEAMWTTIKASGTTHVNASVVATLIGAFYGVNAFPQPIYQQVIGNLPDLIPLLGLKLAQRKR